MNDLANLFKPNWTDQSNPIPALLAMADASLVTLKLAEIVATRELADLKKYHDEVLIPAAAQPYGPAGYGNLINLNGNARLHLEGVLRAIGVQRMVISNWRINVKAGQPTHDASNFPVLPTVLVEYVNTLIVT